MRAAASAHALSLLDAPITERDWQARAWERMRDIRATRCGWTLDDALAHPVIGRTVRAFAAQLQREHAQACERRERELRYGRRVIYTGFGYRPARSTLKKGIR